MMTAALEIIGHIKVPDSVVDHRFYKEAEAISKLFQKNIKDRSTREPVIGTTNNGEVELYGWAKNVAKHSDNTGIIYFAALNDSESLVVTVDDSKETVITLKQGDVVRMNDFIPHFTFDEKPRVCAFLGSFEAKNDDAALEKLIKGVKALARGKYYGAPRVAYGFRAILKDECYVMTKDGDGVELMLIKDAEKKKRFIQTCGLCDKVAVKIDRHFPYFTEMNRCQSHLRMD